MSISDLVGMALGLMLINDGNTRIKTIIFTIQPNHVILGYLEIKGEVSHGIHAWLP